MSWLARHASSPCGMWGFFGDHVGMRNCCWSCAAQAIDPVGHARMQFKRRECKEDGKAITFKSLGSHEAAGSQKA